MPDGTGEQLGWEAADRAVAEAVAARHAELRRPILVGLAGAQGSGKSTMARRLAGLLDGSGLRTAVLALDDFYLTRAEREVLASNVHTLLETRGVPGTHDVPPLLAAIERLLAGSSADVPLFDKATDDRSGWREITGPIDVSLLEGWCVGARSQSPEDLAAPVNALERDEDADGNWRRWVNGRLASDYADLWARLDLRVFLAAPDFDVVHAWRAEQEDDLDTPAMSRTGLARFIAHYERITRAMLADDSADLTIRLDQTRRPVAITVR